MDSAKTRFKISHLKIDGGVLVSNNTLEPLRDCDGAAGPSDPGLGGRRDGLRLEGFEPGPPLGIATARAKNNLSHFPRPSQQFFYTASEQFHSWVS